MGARGGFLASRGQTLVGQSPSPNPLLAPDTLGCLSPTLPRHLERAKFIRVEKPQSTSEPAAPHQLLGAQELSCLQFVTSFLTEQVEAGLAPGSLAQQELLSPWFVEQR